MLTVHDAWNDLLGDATHRIVCDVDTLELSDSDDNTTNDIAGVSGMNNPKETTPSPHHQPIIPPKDPRLHLSRPSLVSTSYQPSSEDAPWLLSSIRKVDVLHPLVRKP